MDTKEITKKNAESILAKFQDNFEITKITPFEELIDEELGNDFQFSFEIVTLAPDHTVTVNGIPFTVTVSSDGYVCVCREDINTEIEFQIENFDEPNFFENFFNEF